MWVCLSLDQIYTSHLGFSPPSSQIAIGHGYKWMVDMFNGARDLVDANNWKDDLLDDGTDLNNKDIFDAK